jgi:iron complex transport system substrate-binding protein
MRRVVVPCLVALLVACGQQTPGGQRAAVEETAAVTASPPGQETPAAARDGVPPPTAPPATPPQPRLPVTVTDARGEDVTVTDVSRIVSLTGSTTEVIYTLGLFDNLVGVDLSAIWPPEASRIARIGYQRALGAEGILALEPTVIIGTDEAGPPEVLEQLRGSGVPTVILGFDDSLDTPAAKARAVAQALGVPEEGERVAEGVERDIAAAVDRARQASGAPRTAFVYYRGPETILLGGRGTVSQTMIEAAGGIDAGADSGLEGTVPLTPEALAAAQPEVLLFPQRGLDAAGGPEGALSLPGVAQTPAGRDGRIIGIDDQALLGLGPRTGLALAELVDRLHADA